MRQALRFARAAGGLAVVVVALAAAALASPGASERSTQQAGTFRLSVPSGWLSGIDPALVGSFDLVRPACGSLMAYPHRRLPAGLRLVPELAASNPVVSKDRRTYTFTIRANARFSTGAPVTARDFEHSLERIFDPSLAGISVSYYFDGIVGAQAMAEGKATRIRGVTARGRTLRLRLTKPVPDFPARLIHLCAIPDGLPVDPEGARAPIPSAAPYYFSRYVAGETAVLERNRFYRGSRPGRVDRITADLTADAGDLDLVARGTVDYVWPAPDLNTRLAELVRRYGINRSRFFTVPSLATRFFFLNTAHPLFRDNVELRRAVNFAVDRPALTREVGPPASAIPTDQILPHAMAGFRDARVYPLDGPDLGRARALAQGNTRSGRAVLYTCTRPDCVAPAQVLRRNLSAIGLRVTIKTFPTQVFFRRAFTPSEPVDILWLGWEASYADPHEFMILFDGRTENPSRFRSSQYDRLLDRAARLDGRARYRAYGDLDVRLVRDTAPVVPYSVLNVWAFVSERTGCITMNPYLDLTAVCLK